MADDRRVFETFECAPGLRLQAHEKVCQIHHDMLCQRLDRIEDMMTRLEKRLWLAVYGVAAAILAQAFQSILSVTP
ncbi:GTA head formation protein, RCAP_rcc01685 family [Marinibacterium sp. SX1]|uniref:GTA head formation protein, RCAP_rcc01685 family n=1 Tax=Marinibacterium sp. SX1 TaxID=3388424 RepID=UPI003D16FACB